MRRNRVKARTCGTCSTGLCEKVRGRGSGSGGACRDRRVRHAPPEARKYAILRTSLVTGGTAPHVATTSLVNLALLPRGLLASSRPTPTKLSRRRDREKEATWSGPEVPGSTYSTPSMPPAL